ncbi:MAG: YbjN domain-containing protein [Nitrospirae bacterium]|nr:YbjN domain-containing protein [Nitrospirota bacterium]
MGRHFEKVKHYLMELNLHIVSEDEEKELVVVSDENLGIKNMVIDCEEPILIFEQIIMEVPITQGDLFKRLLQMNRHLVHGAFVLDDQAKYILFRDTLELENLDKNELDGSIRALTLALIENSSELIRFNNMEV